MKVPQFILAAFMGAILALQGWTLQSIVHLREDVAALKAERGASNLADR